ASMCLAAGRGRVLMERLFIRDWQTMAAVDMPLYQELLWPGLQAVTNSSRGVWALTEAGTALVTDTVLTDSQRSERILELRARYLTDLRTARKARLPHDDGEPDDAEPSGEPGWKEQLLEH